MSVKPSSEPSVIQGLHSWLTTECARQNMQLGTERDQLAAENQLLRGALQAIDRHNDSPRRYDAHIDQIIKAALSGGKEVV